MTRDHRKPGVIRVICTDSYHEDTDEWAERGYHHIGTLRLAYRKGFTDAGFRWTGPAVAKLPLPVKEWRTENDKFVFRFDCTCGRGPQRHESYLADLARRWHAAKPDCPRVMLDITRL